MNTYELNDGTIIYGVHDAQHCAGRHCTIHNPSDHQYRDYPQVFDMGLMERRLPNGTYILDPDDAAFRGTKLIRNSVRCLLCKEHIQSRHTWNLVDCSCGKVSVDGGYDYPRISGDLENIENTAIYLN